LSASLVVVKNLSRYYGTLCAINDLSFAVQRGQILGFLGANGAGKSTTMQILAGVLAPTTGQVIIAGHDLFDQPLLAKAAIGYLPEYPPLYKDMTVVEYLLFCAKLRRVANVASALARVLALCSLETVAHKSISVLSKGYQQRVGIAQAIIHNPEVLILDEPTVGLDPIQMREIRQLIRELGQEHSVILSTHILSEVQAICNQVQILHKGQLILNDSIDALMQTKSLIVSLHNIPPITELATIHGVQQVEIIDANRVKIWHSVELNPTQTIVERSVAENWGLFALIPEQQSLEQIFVTLTT
jgi:ABC-2 type transport system ATP-binding protein